MIQGTTPTHIFELPFDVSMITSVSVSYIQLGGVVLTKSTDKCTLSGNTISVDLTQEETFLFQSDKSVGIQLKVLTSEGQVLASVPQYINVKECFDKEVLK